MIALSWRRHQMETFSALLAFCGGNSPVIGDFPSQRPVTRSFDGFFVQRLNKRLSKHSRRRWFETPSRLLWRHCNGCVNNLMIKIWSWFHHICCFLSLMSHKPAVWFHFDWLCLCLLCDIFVFKFIIKVTSHERHGLSIHKRQGGLFKRLSTKLH